MKRQSKWIYPAALALTVLLAALLSMRSRQLLLIHHDPRSTDEALLAREARLAGKARYAREGEEIVL